MVVHRRQKLFLSATLIECGQELIADRCRIALDGQLFGLGVKAVGQLPGLLEYLVDCALAEYLVGAIDPDTHLFRG